MTGSSQAEAPQLSSDIEEQLRAARSITESLRRSIGEVIVGQEQVVEQALLSLLAGGHVLLEGAPGLGKTLLVRTIAQCLDLSFSRIQFTPDLMPSDITGNNVLLLDGRGGAGGRFELHKGPIFGQLVLADEINRATPKTQSALLEAMQERTVTIAGQRHALPHPFMVLATQNPIEMEGTYPLPEAQLDRFLFKIIVPSPSADELTEILARTTARSVDAPKPIISQAQVQKLQALCREVLIARPLLQYCARLVDASNPESTVAPDVVKKGLRFGAGVRAAQSLVLGAKARALVSGRSNVAFEDIRAVAAPALRHRLLLSFAGEADGVQVDSVVLQLLEQVPERPASVQQALA